MLCPIKVNSNTIELTIHTSCYCILDLLCGITFSLKISAFSSGVCISGSRAPSAAHWSTDSCHVKPLSRKNPHAQEPSDL